MDAVRRRELTVPLTGLWHRPSAAPPGQSRGTPSRGRSGRRSSGRHRGIAPRACDRTHRGDYREIFFPRDRRQCHVRAGTPQRLHLRHRGAGRARVVLKASHRAAEAPLASTAPPTASKTLAATSTAARAQNERRRAPYVENAGYTVLAAPRNDETLRKPDDRRRNPSHIPKPVSRTRSC